MKDIRKTMAEIAEIDGCTVVVVGTCSDPRRSDLYFMAVYPKGSVFVRQAYLGTHKNLHLHVRNALTGARMLENGAGFEPGPLPTNLPVTYQPEWMKASLQWLVGWLDENAGTPEAIHLTSVLDTRLLAAPDGTREVIYNSLVRLPQTRLDVLDLVDRHRWLIDKLGLATIVDRAMVANAKSIPLFAKGGDAAARDLLPSNDWRDQFDENFPAMDYRNRGSWPIGTIALKACAGMPFDGDREKNSYGVNSKMLRFLTTLPADWIPSNVDPQWELCSTLSKIAGSRTCPLPEHLGPLMAGTGGRFDVLYDRLLRSHDSSSVRSQDELELELRRIEEMLTAFSTDVVLPSLRVAGLPVAPHEHAVAKALLGFGTLVSLSDLSRRWHADERLIRTSIQGFDDRSWPALTKPFQAPNRCDVVALTTAGELDSEGLSGKDSSGVEGMSHCVGGRAALCSFGHSHVFSVRRSSGRSFERISTFEVEMRDGLPKIVEHRGRRNSTPDPQAIAAVEAWTRVAGSRKLPFAEEALVVREGMRETGKRTDEDLLRLSIPAWSGLMKRKFRHLDPIDLAYAVLDMLTPPAVSKPPAPKADGDCIKPRL